MLFDLFRRRPLRLVIDRGRVGCPVRNADVEIDVCLQCRSLEAVDERAKIPAVICRPESPAYQGMLEPS